MYEESKTTSDFAIASLIFSCFAVVFGLFTAIPGIILGHIAIKEIKNNSYLKGKGLAVSGLVVGYFCSLISIAFIITIFLLISHFDKIDNSNFEKGNCFNRQSDYSQATIYFKKATKEKYCRCCAYNNLAWLQATCPIAKYRDGKRAVENATKGCELLMDKKDNDHYAAHLDTLACAYAESGDFPQAIKVIKKAIELDSKQNDFKKRLALFQNQKPYWRKSKKD